MRQLVGRRLGGGLVGGFYDEVEDASDAQIPDALETEQRERPLDGGGFRVGDPLEGAHLDDGGEPHDVTPHQAAKERPLICS